MQYKSHLPSCFTVSHFRIKRFSHFRMSASRLAIRSLRSCCCRLVRLHPGTPHTLPHTVPTPISYLPVRLLSSVPDPPHYEINLTPQQLRELLDSCNVVDVRQPEELVEFGAVPGSVNVPLGELAGRLGDLPTENTVFVCQRGFRSLKAISLALEAGFEAPRHLQGGMEAWNEAFKN